VTLADFLQQIVSILEKAEVPYMLTGSLAAAYYAVPRATQDIDLVVDLELIDPSDLAGLLSAAGFYVSASAAREAASHEGQFNAIDPETGWKVDFIIRKGRPFSRSEFSRRVRRSALGLDLYMVTREDLVVAKLEWAKKGESELQLRDVRALLKTAGPEFDRDYVSRWIRDLDLGEQWSAVQPHDTPESDDPSPG
jgi:hypothetical protein